MCIHAVSFSAVDAFQVPGYTRRLEREWSYSDKVYQMLSDYMAKYVQPICTSAVFFAFAVL